MDTTIEAIKKFIPQIYWKAVDECCELYLSRKCEEMGNELPKPINVSELKIHTEATKLLASKQSQLEELKQKLKFVDDLILRSELTNDQIHNIAVEFVRNNEHRPKDRILFFELGMREFRDKHFREEVLRRDVFNRNICNNISKHADDVVIKSYQKESAQQREIEELKSLLQESNARIDKLNIGIFMTWITEQGWAYNQTEGTYKKWNGSEFIYKTDSELFSAYLHSSSFTIEPETEGNTIVRNNLMKEVGYSPYCGNNISRQLAGGCYNPRTKFNGSQFVCPKCGWTSGFPDDFIARYKAKWNIT